MKVAYVHIPKTGGGSIKHWWYQDVIGKHELVTHAHCDLPGVLAETAQIVDTSFTVVRNTWSRLISVYIFAKHKAEKKLRKRPGNADAAQTLHHHSQGIIPFLAWMRESDHINTWCQVRYSQGVEHIIVDHDAQQWQQFAKILQIDTYPQRTHRVQDYDTSTWMTREFIDWTAKNYSAEIQRFGFGPKHK